MKKSKSTACGGYLAKSNSFANDSDEDRWSDGGAESAYQSKKWYEDFGECALQAKGEIKFEMLEGLRKEAKTSLDGNVALNAGKLPRTITKSNFLWIKTVMAKGTKTDKIAAYVVLIQDSPLYNLHLLNNIIGMIKVAKKEWTMAADSLHELFLNDLLPPDRKLITFSQRPFTELDELSCGNENKRKNILMYWYFENELKIAYRDFIVALNQIARDAVDANKEKVITIMFKLLESNPEQESALLSNIVNKLGDPSHKVGSKVIYILTKLLETHPNMREVVLEEVEKLIFRPNISSRAQYYSICFLSQFCLTNDESELSGKLISVYLSVFRCCIKTGDIDSRMMNAILTGVNRAYPYVKEGREALQEHINTIYKVVHIGKPSVSIQALSLLYLMSGGTNSISDRFFMVLYKKISEPKLFNSTHHAMFLSLIYKALKSDPSIERVSAFLKRLFQISAYLPSSIVCGLLFIISEIMCLKKNSLLMEHKAASVSDSKRLYEEDEDDDGYEHYEDANLDSSAEDSGMDVKSAKHSPIAHIGMPAKNVGETEVKEPETWRNPYVSPEDRETLVTQYDPYHRNPLYAGGNRSALVEINKLCAHYHPSVSHFAKKILNGEKISYSGDPLQDFALIRFLDKFSFKNPKVIQSESEEKETFSKFGKRKLYSQTIVHRLRRSADAFLKLSEKNVPADEKFLYNYLKSKQSLAEGKKEDDSDVESVGSDEFEDMLNNMMDSGNQDDIDFLTEAGQLPKASQDSVAQNEESGDDECDGTDDDDDDDDDGSFAADFDGDEVDEISDELMEGSELEDDEIPDALRNLNVGKKSKDRFCKKSLFAPAEEFSELLEQTDYHAGGSQAVCNRDNSGVKQLKWEQKRNEFVKRRDYKNSKKGYGKKNSDRKKLKTRRTMKTNNVRI